jgi:TRAP-type C4-dicarboxylate transport system permease small subunit
MDRPTPVQLPDPEPPRPTIADAVPVMIVRRIVEAVTVVGVASYSILICAQVFFRYVLNSSLVWSEELVQFILLWTVMLGSAIATDRGAHITLNPLEEHLGPRERRIKNGLAELGTICFCGVLAYYGFVLAYRTRFMTSSAADIPMPYAYMAMPVGALLIIFFATVHAIAGTVHRADPMDERS